MNAEPFWETQWAPQHLPPPGQERWDRVWNELTDGFPPETAPAGTVLYQQGDPAREVFYLQSGQIQVECIHSSGKKRVLYLLFDGIPVGEDECMFGGVREFRAVAATQCQLFRIPAEVFKQRVEASPALALKLFQSSARKSQVLSRMLVRDNFQGVRERVLQLLVTLAGRYGTEEAEGVRLTLRLTHQEVADLLGISRVAATQCLLALRREGLVKKRGQFYLLSRPRAAETRPEAPPDF